MLNRAAAVLSLLTLSCSSNPDSPGHGSGGSNANGGASPANGGATSPTSGGSAASGAVNASGGTASTQGGGTSQGGGITSGGSTASGGAGGSGALASTGGTVASGGISAGGSTMGGTTASGGRIATGGAATSGGANTSGGAAASGGAPSTTGAIFIAPTGSDTNAGTIAAPFLTLAKAVSAVAAGGTIYVRGGTFNYSAMVTLAGSGSAASLTKIFAYQEEKPIFNFSTQPYGASNRGILLTGNYWHIKGIEIAYAGDNGIKLEGSHNKIEQCVFHHNGDSGLQLGFGHETVNPNGELCAYNEIVNCDSYLNFDFDSRGGDSDGFACKMHNGKGNVFRGCRAWHNADDGWDLYETDWAVEIHDSWTWHNGDQADFNAIYLEKMGKAMSSYSGNGNGFKLGGNGTGGDSKGLHVVKNCVSFDNNFRSKKGFDQNSHKGGVLIQNSVAWGNGYNFMFEEDAESGSKNEFVNNVSFLPATSLGLEFSAGSMLRNNSWQLTITADAADFVDLTEAAAKAPRQADGSLPNNGFARLAAGSDLIDKGVDVQAPFTGAAPDLGAFER